MKKTDFDQIATIADLVRLKNELKDIIFSAINPSKEFYTPKEFAYKVGMNYSTVIYKCAVGKLKAHQDSPNSSWFIDSSEIDRIRKRANDNNTID